MKLSDDRFFKGVYNYRTKTDGPVLSIPRLSYESGDRLYDVILYPFGTIYLVNSTPHLTVSPIHREILKHYNEQHVEWKGEQDARSIPTV